MKKIPEDKQEFYSKQQQNLRGLRNQLQLAVGNLNISFSSLSQLEIEIVKEAFRSIAEEGSEVFVTFDKGVYAMDLERMRGRDSRVLYLLCNQEGDLQDLSPLLPFVSAKRRKEYEDLRAKYLCSD